ncbi:hypothetical protein V6N13_027114 [Hibiscus sabdariffa]
MTVPVQMYQYAFNEKRELEIQANEKGIEERISAPKLLSTLLLLSLLATLLYIQFHMKLPYSNDKALIKILGGFKQFSWKVNLFLGEKQMLETQQWLP